MSLVTSDIEEHQIPRSSDFMHVRAGSAKGLGFYGAMEYSAWGMKFNTKKCQIMSIASGKSHPTYLYN